MSKVPLEMNFDDLHFPEETYTDPSEIDAFTPPKFIRIAIAQQVYLIEELWTELDTTSAPKQQMNFLRQSLLTRRHILDDLLDKLDISLEIHGQEEEELHEDFKL